MAASSVGIMRFKTIVRPHAGSSIDCGWRVLPQIVEGHRLPVFSASRVRFFDFLQLVLRVVSDLKRPLWWSCLQRTLVRVVVATGLASSSGLGSL